MASGKMGMTSEELGEVLLEYKNNPVGELDWVSGEMRLESWVRSRSYLSLVFCQ